LAQNQLAARSQSDPDCNLACPVGRARREEAAKIGAGCQQDAAELATLIVATLEGSLMVSRLQRKEDPLRLALRHLEEYLEITVRTRNSSSSPNTAGQEPSQDTCGVIGS
jgi:hypothetical protein